MWSLQTPPPICRLHTHIAHTLLRLFYFSSTPQLKYLKSYNKGMDSTISMPYCIRCHSYRDNGFPLLCMKGLDEFPINLFTGSHKDQILLHYCFSAQRHYRLSANTLSQPWLNQVLPPLWFSGQFPIILAVSPPRLVKEHLYLFLQLPSFLLFFRTSFHEWPFVF